VKLRNKDKLYIYHRDNKRCYYCGKTLKFNQTTLDHFIPLSKGGTDDIFNIVTCCKKCNKIKGDNLPDNYGEVIIELFIQAVKDDMIIGKGLKLNNKELKKELLKVDRIEDINDSFVFQSVNMRFYIKNSTVVKIVYLGGKDEYNDNFCWED
jgi:hypothetical protein